MKSLLYEKYLISQLLAGEHYVGLIVNMFNLKYSKG